MDALVELDLLEAIASSNSYASFVLSIHTRSMNQFLKLFVERFAFFMVKSAILTLQKSWGDVSRVLKFEHHLKVTS